MKAIIILLGMSLVFGLTSISEAKKPNPAIDNTVILCAGPREVPIKSNPSSPVCVGTSVQFSIILPCGWTFVSANWTFSGGTPATGSGATPSTTYNTPGEDYAVTMNGTAKDKCGQSRCITGAMTVTVFGVDKVEVSPKKKEVPVDKTQDFTAKLIWFGADGIEGTADDMDVTQYCSNSIQWSTKGQGKEDIGDVNPKTGSTTTFTAREELPVGKNKLTGHVIATSGDVSSQALVTVVNWELKLLVRIIGSPHTKWEEVEEKVIKLGETAEFEATGSLNWWWYSFVWEGVDSGTIKSKKSSSTASKKYETYGVYEAKVTVTPRLFPWWHRTKTFKAIVVEVESSEIPIITGYMLGEGNVVEPLAKDIILTVDPAEYADDLALSLGGVHPERAELADIIADPEAGKITLKVKGKDKTPVEAGRDKGDTSLEIKFKGHLIKNIPIVVVIPKFQSRELGKMIISQDIVSEAPAEISDVLTDSGAIGSAPYSAIYAITTINIKDQFNYQLDVVYDKSSNAVWEKLTGKPELEGFMKYPSGELKGGVIQDLIGDFLFDNNLVLTNNETVLWRNRKLSIMADEEKNLYIAPDGHYNIYHALELFNKVVYNSVQEIWVHGVHGHKIEDKYRRIIKTSKSETHFGKSVTETKE